MTKNHQSFLHTVIVPVAKPETAYHMLELASKLVHPDNGSVIALMVTLDESEKENENIEVIQPICVHFQERDLPVELETVKATSVSRGILDVTRERGADAVIMGVQVSEKGNVKLGSIVENVLQAAPCDVLIYRYLERNVESAHKTPGDRNLYRNVRVPIEDTPIKSKVWQIGKLLAEGYTIPFSPMSVPSISQHDLDMRDTFAVQLASFVQILSRPDNLLVLGFVRTKDDDRVQSDDLSDKLLEHAHGSVLLIVHPRTIEESVGPLQRFLNWVTPTLTIAEQNQLVRQAQKDALLNIDYVVMILLSAALASLGLLLNSSAVIIGAMLVAPLMQPLAASAIGLSEGLFSLLGRALLSLIQGVVLALMIAMIVGFIFPVTVVTDEMAARGNPTLIDAGVALVSGLVAAYATARKGVSAALAGVAIAAALMPPLTTVGLGMAMGNTELALGALLLFFTNILFIILAEYLVFLWLGMRPGQIEGTIRWQRVWWGITGILLVGVIAILLNLSRDAVNQVVINQKLERFFSEQDFLGFEQVGGKDEVLQIVASIRAEQEISPEFVQEVEDSLIQELNREVTLDVVALPVVDTQPNDSTIGEFLSTAFGQGELVTYELIPGEPSRVIATIRTDAEITLEQVEIASESLSDLMEEDVALEVVLQQVLRSP